MNSLIKIHKFILSVYIYIYIYEKEREIETILQHSFTSP